MSQKKQELERDFHSQAEQAAGVGDWKTAMEFYARSADQHTAELALINSVQEGLSSKMDMQAIYDLVGDKLRDTFDAQVVMISQYDPNSKKVFHHYAIERGQHLHIQDWQPVDSSRAEIIRTCKPFMINMDEINRVVHAGKMRVIPGTELPKTWLGVPMLVGNTARGIVSLQNLDKENAFSRQDIDLLMTLTNSMSVSLENARLLKETQRLLRLMEDEMKIARRTQRNILPRAPQREGYDLGSLITPARAVGGDFFDFIQMDKNRMGVIIGDVSDKGLPAALFMALTFSMVRAETERSSDPGEILRKVNRYLLKMNALEMFVTLIYGVLNYSTGSFRYARAGHLLPIVLDQDGNDIPVKMSTGQPLGLFDNMLLDKQETVIPPGGMALLYSDGLSEAADLQGHEFGLERIRQELFAHRNESAKGICRKLWEAVDAHSRNIPHQDDFTTVVMKRLA
jgi:serine phosphatase RsbU (regulator of sigma subunit)